MKMTEERGDASYRIRAYSPGSVTVNDRTFTDSIALAPTQLIEDWPPERFEDLAQEHIEQLKALEPEVVILGTGETQRFPGREIMLAMLGEGIGVEVMATEAACRTYNILMAEDRKVVAALLLR